MENSDIKNINKLMETNLEKIKEILPARLLMTKFKFLGLMLLN